MRRLLLIIGVWAAYGHVCCAQTPEECRRALKKRLDKIDYYHVGVGLDIAANCNYQLAPKMYVGIGSERNLFNINLGLKAAIVNPARASRTEYIRYYALPLFAEASANVFRWKGGSAYIGGGVSYVAALGADHHVGNGLTTHESYAIVNDRFSWHGSLGLRIRSWDVSGYYEYDLSPAFDQKYVYESFDYDYYELYNSIFERWRVGVSLVYNFRF